MAPIDPSVLVLLNPDRARAAIAWPLVRRSTKPLDGYVRAAPKVWYDIGHWCELADLPRFTAHRIVEPLLETKMVTYDGGVDPAVIAYARRLVAKEIRRSGRG